MPLLEWVKPHHYRRSLHSPTYSYRSPSFPIGLLGVRPNSNWKICQPNWHEMAQSEPFLSESSPTQSDRNFIGFRNFLGMSDGRIPIGIFGVRVETLWLGLRTEICRTEKICTGRIGTHSCLTISSYDISEHLTINITLNGLVYSTYYLCNDHWMATIYRGGCFCCI